jgi:hypothetical protein
MIIAVLRGVFVVRNQEDVFVRLFNKPPLPTSATGHPDVGDKFAGRFAAVDLCETVN